MAQQATWRFQESLEIGSKQQEKHEQLLLAQTLRECSLSQGYTFSFEIAVQNDPSPSQNIPLKRTYTSCSYKKKRNSFSHYTSRYHHTLMIARAFHSFR